MTTATLSDKAAVLATRNGKDERSGRSLEELAKNLVATLFGTAPETWEQSVGRGIHDARRMRRRGDLDGALAVLEGLDVGDTDPDAARWAHAEWTDTVRRRFAGREVQLYSQGAGKAAALTPVGDGRTLVVLAVLGMRWRLGTEVSRRSLRGLRPLDKSSRVRRKRRTARLA